MIVTPGKFQVMVIKKFGKLENKHEMYIDNRKITSEHSVKLLGIEINNQLSFANHVSTICKKAGSQLNAIGLENKFSRPINRKFLSLENILVSLKKRL